MIIKETTTEEVLKLAPDCKCKSCENGCKHGSGFLTDNQIPRLAKFLKIKEKILKEKFLDEIEKFHTKLHRPKLKSYPLGECIFFDGKCKIHKVKPKECRIAMSCKDYGEDLSIWFTLNHFVNATDPESIRQWNLYIKTGGKMIEGGELKNLVPDKTILKKILSYEVLK